MNTIENIVYSDFNVVGNVVGEFEKASKSGKISDLAHALGNKFVKEEVFLRRASHVYPQYLNSESKIGYDDVIHREPCEHTPQIPTKNKIKNSNLF